MSMKKSIDTIVNRTRDLPACRTVPQPTEPPRSNNQTFTKLLHVLLRYSKVHCFVLRPSRWFGDERKCGGKIKADFFIRNFLYFDIRLNEWYSDMRIQCHVYTVTCVYSDMRIQWHVYTVTCVYSDMCIQCHVYTVTCVYSDMCIQWHVYTVTCV